MANTYSEIREDLKFIADILDDNGFTYKVYNKGIQFNADDRSGITHTYYPTTGTIVLHERNERNKKKIKTFREVSLNEFMCLLIHPEEIKKLF